MLQDFLSRRHASFLFSLSAEKRCSNARVALQLRWRAEVALELVLSCFGNWRPTHDWLHKERNPPLRKVSAFRESPGPAPAQPLEDSRRFGQLNSASCSPASWSDIPVSRWWAQQVHITAARAAILAPSPPFLARPGCFSKPFQARVSKRRVSQRVC